MKERIVSGFNASKAVIFMSRTGMSVEKKKCSKIPNWRHYLLKTRAKRKKYWQNPNKTQQAISKRLKAIGMIQKQGNWVAYELKPRDVERRLFDCEQLRQR